MAFYDLIKTVQKSGVVLVVFIQPPFERQTFGDRIINRGLKVL
jgi:hypothetical protein